MRWAPTAERIPTLRLLDVSYNRLEDFTFVRLLEGLSTLKLQANPGFISAASLESIARLRNLRDLYLETVKFPAHLLQQVPRVKRINGLPAQEVWRDMLASECNSKTVFVGGLTESGAALGHLATTLTSFNVSAIANRTGLESPGAAHELEIN